MGTYRLDWSVHIGKIGAYIYARLVGTYRLDWWVHIGKIHIW